jgi:hypothetical protein
MTDEKPQCMEDVDSLQEGIDYYKGKCEHLGGAEWCLVVQAAGRFAMTNSVVNAGDRQ